MPRTLIETTAAFKRYRVTNAQGQVIGEDIESTVPADLNAAAITVKAQQALTANATFRTIATPTNADIVAQVKALTRQNTALIRLVLGLFDADDA